MPAPAAETLCRILSARGAEQSLDSLPSAEWAPLLDLANSEGLSPMVYWTVSQSGRLESLPDSAKHALSAAYAVTWLHTESALKELETLVAQYRQAKIPVVLLKGVCFAITIYPDIGLRPMGDIDLLVPADRLSDAAAIAKAQGFIKALPEAAPGIDELMSLHVRLQKPGPRPLTLEVHDGLVGGRVMTFAPPIAWFWSQTEAPGGPWRERFAGALMLSPTAQLLYAVAHAMLQHGGRSAPLRWFLDIHLLITHYSDRIDWPLLLSQARAFEWSSALAAALAHTRDCFDTRVPDDVLDALRDVSDRYQALVASLQSRPATRVLEEQEKLAGMSFYGKSRVLLAMVVPSPSYMRWRYQLQSGWRLPGAYLSRWWGIFKDGLETLKVMTVRFRG